MFIEKGYTNNNIICVNIDLYISIKLKQIKIAVRYN